MRFYLFVFILFILSCRKKENAEPQILITSPAAQSIFIPGDTIQVDADISDDGVLSSVTLKLLDAAYIPVDHQESFPINSSSYHLSYKYVIENTYLETGNYLVTLSTNDGTNNRNEFRNIVINGIPKTRKAVYVLLQSDISHIAVARLDSSGNADIQFTIGGDYSASAISSRYNALVEAGKSTGSISRFDLSGDNLIYEIPPYNAPFPSYQYLAQSNELAFVSFYDGRIRAYDKDGQIRFNSAQPVYYRPGVLCVSDKYVFAEADYPSTGEHKLVVINYPSGVARQEYNTGIDIVSMLHVNDDEVILFGNKNGDGKILSYSVINNSSSELHTLYHDTIYEAIFTGGSRYAIASSGGLYSYEESSNNLVPVDVSGPVYSLEYDEVNGIVFANCGKKFKEYDAVSGSLLSTTPLQDSLLAIRIIYNK